MRGRVSTGLGTLGRLAALGLLLLCAQSWLCAQTRAQSSSLRIVAIGASNTSGWGVGTANAYPARLEALLRAKGYDAHVTNAGIPFETTNGMRGRIDSAVPEGTDLVILQPGSNDKRFLWALPSRAANIDAMVKHLTERKIKVIVFDPDFAWSYYQWDFIHLNNDGHAWIAATLLPQVIAAVRPPPPPSKRALKAPPAAPASGKSR
jgi:acyl-CoA thioesterase-1